MSRILIVEDDEAISGLIALNLEAVGHTAVTAGDGNKALEIIQNEKFDLVLLDIMLPGMDGFSLFPHIREHSFPVIYITAKNDISSILKGLREAEDYIVKPFNILELLARIEKILKRTGGLQEVIRIGRVAINEKKRTVQQDGIEVSLKPLEFDVLLMLAKNKNIALTREKLLNALWGIDYMGESRTVDVHIAQLRKKLDITIVTMPKVGYRLED